MFRPSWIPQANPAPHPPELWERGFPTADGTVAPFLKTDAFFETRPVLRLVSAGIDKSDFNVYKDCSVIR